MKLTQLVEGVAGEARGAAGLRVHHRRLGVGGGGERRRSGPAIMNVTGVSPSAKSGDDAERVVDRRADVAVGGGEQRADAVDAAQRLVSAGFAGPSRRCRARPSSPNIRTRPVPAARGRGVRSRRRGAAAERQRQLELLAQQLEHPAGALLAADRQAPERRAARPARRRRRAPARPRRRCRGGCRRPPAPRTRPPTASTTSGSASTRRRRRRRAGARRGWRRRRRPRRARPRARASSAVSTPLTRTGSVHSAASASRSSQSSVGSTSSKISVDRHRPLRADRRATLGTVTLGRDREAGAQVALALAARAARRR